MLFHIHEKYKSIKSLLSESIDHFNEIGDVLHDGRNTVKVIQINDIAFNFKRFKKPNFINKVVYRFFRKSKAQRSFEYAQILLEKNIGTPHPVAYYLDQSSMGLGYSYYISRHEEPDFTYRELINDDSIENKPEILRAYTAFLYNMHESGVYFMDNSPGNTLIYIQEDGSYKFALVDLNRMKFYDIPWNDRLRNFERLSPLKWMYEIMGDEYSKLSRKRNSQETIAQMWNYTQEFQHRFHRKKAFKKKIKSIFK